MHNCKHFEVCNLGAAFSNPAGGFCILHYPTEDKPARDFDSAVKHHLDAGRSDFRYVFFVREYSGLEGVHFRGLADYRNVVSRAGLRLRKAHLPQGLKIMGNDPLELLLQGAIVEGPVEIERPLFGMNASTAEFHGDVSIVVGQANEINLQRATLVKGLTLRAPQATSRCRFDGATIQGVLDLSQCRFADDLNFTRTIFSSSSELHLQASHISKDLILIGCPDVPAAIHLNGSEIVGKTHIEAKLDTSMTRIVAPQKYPQFDGDVTFINVDLSECRLVGNPITRVQRMDLTNVKWEWRHGRWMLCDEIAMRRKASVPVSNLKEVYQVLKQKYQQVGEHVISGDFHYGEMEMRRREYGWPWRLLCPEILYWAFSGYGTRWFRALIMLSILVAGFAIAYYRSDPVPFSNDFLEALRFSVQVTTLQRPPAPQGFGAVGNWLQVIQSILGPLQIALFALALRMRLRR